MRFSSRKHYGVMRTIITRFLVTCLMAISLHGFGTDEHVFKVQGEEALITLADAADKSGDTVPNLGAVCDICEVVHQYVAINTNALALPMAARDSEALSFLSPSGRHANDILHPPTA
jgi:hypothetical protein